MYVKGRGLGDQTVPTSNAPGLPTVYADPTCQPWESLSAPPIVAGVAVGARVCAVTPQSLFTAPGALATKLTGAGFGTAGLLFGSMPFNAAAWFGIGWLALKMIKGKR
jgi:hypothetical protein